ncbi:MAG: ABC transporter substrate-binding protein [Cyanobacteria bacterium M5B4]|nr:MAG: ABC transporter substrate-binding protein [Cyanobacteria bacterium M5B4]
MNKLGLGLLGLGLALVGVGCQVTVNAPLPSSGCISKYEPDRDYFPVKTTVKHALGFEVSYHRHYKIITVKEPWQNAKQKFRYVLVQCGTPVPPGFQAAEIIQVPISSIVILSTTHLPHLEKLELLDRLVAMSNLELIYGAELQTRLKQLGVKDLGRGNTVNVEQILALRPGLVTAYGTGSTDRDRHPKLLEAGLKVALNAEYMESSPLGRAEWLKFTALFFNEEKQANQIFAEMETRYNKMAAIARTAKTQPTVVTGFHRNGTWYMAGGKSYVAQYLRDAGANYLWQNDATRGSNPLSFEAVYRRGRSADFWINVSQDWRSKEDILKADVRYRDFRAWQTGNVYIPNARISPTGGNDYWQSGIANPDVILADLVKIFHPELLPSHQLFYYQKVAP